MTTRILCVDDDSNILLGYQRALQQHEFVNEVQTSPAAGT
jgi:DNA-binding response OmpR family regulator